jgi:hypothetical protein
VSRQSLLPPVKRFRRRPLPESQKSVLAAPGSTGNNAHASVRCNPAAQKPAFQLVVELGGTTPAISWLIQGALDVDQISDANANWFTLPLILPSSDSIAASPIVIASATTAGIPTFEIARMAGTSVLQIEKTYGHMLPDAMERGRAAASEAASSTSDPARRRDFFTRRVRA